MKWNKKTRTPVRKGWYITRTDDGFIDWRCWGNGAWWKQLTGGWIEWFDADGNSMRFEWLTSPRMSVKLDRKQLPEISAALGKEKS